MPLEWIDTGDYDDHIPFKEMMTADELEDYCPRGSSNHSSAFHETGHASKLFNLSCIEAFTSTLEQQLRRYSEWEVVLYTCAYAVISVLAAIGNGMVIIVVIRKRAMRTNRNVLIVNLAVSNLMLALTNIPLLWLPSVQFRFPNSKVLCKIGNVLPGSNIYCSTLTICVMAIDRYYSVRRLSLGARPGLARAVIVAMAIWVVSFVLNLPLLIYYDIVMLYVFRNVPAISDKGPDSVSFGWPQCQMVTGNGTETGASTVESAKILITVTQVAFLYLIPLVVLSHFNIKLTSFLKTNASQMSSHRRIDRSNYELSRALSPRSNGVSPTLAAASSALVAPSRSSRNGSVRSMFTRTPAAEQATERRTSRTTALLVAMAASYGVLWLPFTLISLLIDLNVLDLEHHASIVDRLDQACKVISMLSICVNPFLYGFLNTNFRHEFTEILYLLCLRCTNKSQLNTRRGFHPELSSLAFGLRPNSSPPGENRSTVLSTVRRSFRESIDKVRGSAADGATLSGSFRAKNGTLRASLSTSRMRRSELSVDRVTLTLQPYDAEPETISVL